jgi:hypothetical protein
VIWDREGYVKENNFDVRFHDEMKPLTELFANYCGASVSAIYVTHINWFFRSMFKIAKTFSSKPTFSMVNLVDSPKHLIQHFDSDQLRMMGYLKV